jgi:hypothetical protein
MNVKDTKANKKEIVRMANDNTIYNISKGNGYS